jgi:PAS domain S-box-containing protein
MAARPLRLILTLQTILVAVLPFLVMAVLGAVWFLPQIRADIEARQGLLAQSIVFQVESYLASPRAEVGHLAALLPREEQIQEHLQDILSAHVPPDGTLGSLYVAGPQGQVRALAQAGQRPEQSRDLLDLDLSRNHLFQEVKRQGGPVWSDAFLSLVSGGLSVALGMPSDQSVVIGELRLDLLSRHFQQIISEPQQLVLVLDHRGQVLADRQGSHTAQQLNISALPLVERGLRSAQPAQGPLEFEGVEMIAGLAKAQSLDWYVLVALPRQVAYQPLWTIAGILAWALVLTLAAGVAAAVLLSRRLAGRFEVLAAHARRVTRGEDPGLAPDSSITEFQTLGQGLEHMVAAARRREESLSLSEARLQRAQAMAHVGSWEIDLAQGAIWGSEEALRIYGLPSQPSVVSLKMVQGMAHPDDRQRNDQALAAMLKQGLTYDNEFRIIRAGDGQVRFIHSLAQVVRGQAGQPLKVVGTLQDITQVKLAQGERDRLAAQLRQAQKMEAVGTLAGGIAHDFNNILAIILGNADMAQEDAPAQGPLREMLERIQSACQRGKGLVNQILAFSRQRGRQPVATEPAIIWKETLKLLKATLPANIRIEPHLGAAGRKTLADPTELHQILLNLCANAAHAMRQEGGVLTVTLTEAQVPEQNLPGALAPGDYLRLTVSDTGHGMDQATQERIFEPYFSTKPPSEGTGLGLAVVHGLVQGNGGAISVQSQVGHGTAFEVLLPLAAATAAPASVQPQAAARGTGSILMVDDEPEVLTVGSGILERQGYRVMGQTNGERAWRAFLDHPRGFDLVVTDQAMPELTGLGLAKRIRALPSDVPIILCTGFLEPRLEGEVAQLGIAEVVQKPYSRVRLAGAAQRALASREPRA